MNLQLASVREVVQILSQLLINQVTLNRDIVHVHGGFKLRVLLLQRLNLDLRRLPLLQDRQTTNTTLMRLTLQLPNILCSMDQFHFKRVFFLPQPHTFSLNVVNHSLVRIKGGNLCPELCILYFQLCEAFVFLPLLGCLLLCSLKQRLVPLNVPSTAGVLQAWRAADFPC